MNQSGGWGRDETIRKVGNGMKTIRRVGKGWKHKYEN